MSRKNRDVDGYADVMTLSEWEDAVSDGLFNEDDGSGCWVKDGKYMFDSVFDDVFGPVPEGATHVAWFNK
jgi:hypothetical protein